MRSHGKIALLESQSKISCFRHCACQTKYMDQKKKKKEIAPFLGVFTIESIMVF